MCGTHTHSHTHIHTLTHIHVWNTHKQNKPHPWKQTNVKSWRGRRASRLLSDTCYVSKIGRLKLLTLHYTSSPRTRTSCSCCKTPFPRTWSQSTHLLVACLECRPGTLVPLWFPLCRLIMFSLKGHTPMSRRRYPEKKNDKNHLSKLNTSTFYKAIKSISQKWNYNLNFWIIKFHFSEQINMSSRRTWQYYHHVQ